MCDFFQIKNCSWKAGEKKVKLMFHDGTEKSCLGEEWNPLPSCETVKTENTKLETLNLEVGQKYKVLYLFFCVKTRILISNL